MFCSRQLAAGNTPKHQTICGFREVHLKALRALLWQVVLVGREMGFVQLGQVAVDGTKVRTNASKRNSDEAWTDGAGVAEAQG